MATNLTRRGASANNQARLPALPAAQQVADPVARDLFELIREWLEVRLGARGDFYERAVTHRELKAQLEQLQATQASTDTAQLLGRLNLLTGQLAALTRQLSLVQSLVNNTITNSSTEVNNLYTNLRGVAVEDVAVFAVDMRPTFTGGCEPIETIEFTATQPNFHALPFLANVDTSADFHTMLPFSWAGKQFKVWVYWGHGSGGTAWDVAWEVTANSTYDNESVNIDFAPGALVTDAGGTPGNLYIALSPTIPIASYENEEGSMVSLRITRRGTFTEDTMDITAYLLAVRFTLDDIPLVAPTSTIEAVGFAYTTLATDDDLAVPVHAAGDLIVVFARSSAGATVPGAPSGFTPVESEAPAFGSGWRVSWAIDTGGTITTVNCASALYIAIHVYSGASGVGAHAQTSVTLGTPGTIPALTLDVTDNTSWVAAFGTLNQDKTPSVPTGMTLRGEVADILGGGDMRSWDTDGPVSAWTSQTISWVGASSAYGSFIAVEILSA